MFNIIETLRNYFTRDSLSSDVALHFNVGHRRPYLAVSCSEEVFCRPVFLRVSASQIKSNLFAIVKMHNKQFIKITFHLAGQTGDSYALMSAHKN